MKTSVQTDVDSVDSVNLRLRFSTGRRRLVENLSSQRRPVENLSPKSTVFSAPGKLLLRFSTGRRRPVEKLSSQRRT